MFLKNRRFDLELVKALAWRFCFLLVADRKRMFFENQLFERGSLLVFDTKRNSKTTFKNELLESDDFSRKTYQLFLIYGGLMTALEGWCPQSPILLHL